MAVDLEKFHLYYIKGEVEKQICDGLTIEQAITLGRWIDRKSRNWRSGSSGSGNPLTPTRRPLRRSIAVTVSESLPDGRPPYSPTPRPMPPLVTAVAWSIDQPELVSMMVRVEEIHR